MAGWTTNRQGKQLALPQPTAAAPPPVGLEPGAPGPMTLDQVLAPSGWDDERPHRPNAAQQVQLSRIVEAEIIPRLMLLHRAAPLQARAPAPALLIGPAQVQALGGLAVADDPAAASAYVQQLITAGASQEQVFLDLLAPCARHLGVQWEEDVYSFSQVTIGLWRLQCVLHDLAGRPDRVAPFEPDSRRILLAAVPGSQHTFGVSMAAEFFSRAGWDVDCEPRVSWAGLRDRVGRQWLDVFGLSVSSSEGLPQVASAILDTRRAAANPRLFVMVGGPMAALMPDLARRCGADALALDAPGAISLAQASLVQQVKRA